MNTSTINSDLIRIENATLPHIASISRSSWRVGAFLIACALASAGLSPTVRAVDPSPEGGYPNSDFFSRPYRDVILDDNPIMYWRLGETVGPIAYDESANHRNATYIGNPSLGWPSGIIRDIDTSAKFSGSNQYLLWGPVLDPPGSFNCSGTFTVEAWVKERNFYRSDTFFTTHAVAARFGFDFRFDTITLDLVQKEIRFDVGDGRRWLSISRVPFDFQADVWYYIVAQVTPTGATYYVDGSAIGYTSYNGIPLLFDSTHNVEIGSNPGSSHTPHLTENTIDEVAVYDYALTENQIWAHYFAGKGIVTK